MIATERPAAVAPGVPRIGYPIATLSNLLPGKPGRSLPVSVNCLARHAGRRINLADPTFSTWAGPDSLFLSFLGLSEEILTLAQST